MLGMCTKKKSLVRILPIALLEFLKSILARSRQDLVAYAERVLQSDRLMLMAQWSASL